MSDNRDPKVKSKIDGVYFNAWKTPLTGADNLWFEGLLNTRGGGVHICLSIDQEEDIHVISVINLCPYRIFDEDHDAFMNKYFENDLSDDQYRSVIPKRCRTYRLWGTEFIKEMDCGYFLSGYAPEHNPNLFQYLIVTQSQHIEFISEWKPRWEIFKNKSIEEVYQHLMKHDKDDEWWDEGPAGALVE